MNLDTKSGSQWVDREGIKLDLRNIKELKTLPVIVTRIQEVAGDSGSGAHELAAVVAQDQATSAKVLNLANSAFYGFAKKISTVRQAVVVLGFDTIRSLALSVSVYETFSDSAGKNSFDREAFWMHSIGCGTAARLIAKVLGYREGGTSFSGGLLHDLGKMVLDMHFNDQYAEVIQFLGSGDYSANWVERNVLDTDHAEVGGWLATWWKFPDSLVNPIAYHHAPLDAHEDHLKGTMVVHLANIIAKKAGVGLCYEAEISEPDESVIAYLEITPQQLARVEEELEEERDSIYEFFSQLTS